ncbi:MAG: zinc ribbon domain-containing protein [Vicinamibacterales bacterium]
MSSATSTRTSTFRPWHLFSLAGLLAATVGVVTVQPGDPAALILLVLAIFAGAGVGFGIYRTIWPLADREFHDRTELIGGRTRAALDREKTLVLRAIKELEFDRAMGKVSDSDFRLMGERLRARAIALMKQLDDDTPGYRERIERELAERLQGIGEEPVESGADARPVCDACGANNESDAKFCKRCGSALNLGVAAEDAE